VKALLRRWDPIGVQPDAVASPCRYEYDAYAPQLLPLLYSGASVRQVADRLEHIRTAMIGMAACRASDERFAAELIQLRPTQPVFAADDAFPPPLSPKAAEMTRREWRELGFFYNRDDLGKQWQIIGSRAGLLRLADLLEKYSSNSSFAVSSDHQHYGPHMYLEIMTWDKAGIDAHAIFGTQKDIARLANVIRSGVERARVGDVLIVGSDYSDQCKYNIALSVDDDRFDPSSADPQLAAG